MVGECCRPSALRPRLGLYHDCFRLCAPQPHGHPVGMPMHCLTTVLGGSGPYILRGDGRAWHDNEASNVCRPFPRDSITPRLTFVKRGAENQGHKRGAAHCCATVIILPPSRRSSRSACRGTRNMVGLGAVAPHVRGNEIVHPVASASSARYHMVCGERQRMRRITAPVEWFAAIIAWRSSTLGALAEDGAVAVVESGILAHFRQSPP